MLRAKPPESWLVKVMDNLDGVLVDHAHLERKAAQSALKLQRYNELSQDLNDLTNIAIEELEHFKRVLKTFNVQQLTELLRAKDKPCKGTKPDKAQQVAWIYTSQGIDEWIQAQNPITRPAIMGSEVRPGQTSLDAFFPRSAGFTTGYFFRNSVTI